METRANYVLIGIFALLGFLGVLGFFLAFGKFQLDRQFAYYDVRFDAVSGLSRAAVAVPYSPEFGLPPTTNLLQQLADESGGRVLAEPEEVFAARAAVADTPIQLWHWVLGLALLLWLVDIALRQLRGMRSAE